MTSRPEYSAGWYHDLSNREYHASAAWSSSQLKKLLYHTPAHLSYSLTEQHTQTANQALGSAVHALVLEKCNFNNEIAIKPDIDKRSKVGKQLHAEFEQAEKDKVHITVEQYTQALAMAESVMQNPAARRLLEDSINETSIFWQYQDEVEETFIDLPFRCRPDAIARKVPALVDLKTCQDASYSAIQRAVHNWGYHFSAAMYLDGVDQCQPLLESLGMAYSNFTLICVENTPPYAVAVYDLDDDWLATGAHQMRHASRILQEAIDNNFPSFANEIRTLTLPQYATYTHEV